MDTKLIPKPAILAIAGGLLLMAFFTIMWSGIASAALQNTGRIIDLLFFWGTAVIFVGYAIYFFRSANRFQIAITEAEKKEGKKMGTAYGIIFGLEGIFIPLSAFICIQLGYPQLVLPVIALVVGLHFYPMAKIFRRTLDYYLASWATLIAICAIILTLKHVLLFVPVQALLGVGMAIATSIYGINMIKTGRGYLAV